MKWNKKKNEAYLRGKTDWVELRKPADWWGTKWEGKADDIDIKNFDNPYAGIDLEKSLQWESGFKDAEERQHRRIETKRTLGKIFRFIFLVSVGFFLFISIDVDLDPQPIYDIPFSELTINLILNAFLPLVFYFGCIAYIFFILFTNFDPDLWAEFGGGLLVLIIVISSVMIIYNLI